MKTSKQFLPLKRKGLQCSLKQERLIERYRKIYQQLDFLLKEWSSKINKKVESIEKEDEFILLIESNGKTVRLQCHIVAASSLD